MSNEKDYEAELRKISGDINKIDQAIDKLTTKRHKLVSRKTTINQLIQEQAAEELANQDWERNDHPWSNKVQNVLKSVFKLEKFRPYQLSTINAVLSKQDCILLMPTGGGKSLCYQLPAMVLDGITLVVSPLVSLMEDQLMSLESLGIQAALLNASSTREHVNEVQRQMADKTTAPTLKLLYVTPEKLAKSKRFMAKLEKMHAAGRFSLLAIDEVHCCSQWGHDFRPDYKFLGIMRRQFPNVPILGLTATATSSVITDVQKILNIQACLVLKASFNRPNLKYEVVCKSSSQKDNVTELENLLKNRFNSLSGIIYCFSIKESEDIAKELRTRGIKARAYHAQLDAKYRSQVHRQWASNSLQVVVATVAFGMGIDKPDVRFVIHHSMPKSMESFYQESGRAGRDDHQASCILFFRFQDIFRQSTMVFTEQKGLEHVYSMVSYCLDLSTCRRSLIAQHFGERWNASDCNNMCDHCDSFTPYVEKTRDVTSAYVTICTILIHASVLDERLTSQKVMDAWQGKGPPKFRPPGHKPTALTRDTCERIIALLLLDSYLKEEFHFTPYSTISYINIGSRRLPKGDTLQLPMPVFRSKASPPPTDTSSKKRSLSSDSTDKSKKFKLSDSSDFDDSVNGHLTKSPSSSNSHSSKASTSNSHSLKASNSNSNSLKASTSNSNSLKASTSNSYSLKASTSSSVSSIASISSSGYSSKVSTSSIVERESSNLSARNNHSGKSSKSKNSKKTSNTKTAFGNDLNNKSTEAEEISISSDDDSIELTYNSKESPKSCEFEIDFDDYEVVKSSRKNKNVVIVSDSE